MNRFVYSIPFLFLTLFYSSLFNVIYAQVVINEFSPKNPEWVEFFNQGPNEINLDGYYFDDDTDFNSDSGSSTKVKLQGLFPVNSLCYIDLNSYLNDNGDSPTLFAPNGDIIDTYPYVSSSANLSYSRIPDGSIWQTDTSFSKTSASCQNLYIPTPIPTVSPTSEPTSSPTKSSSPTSVPTIKPSPTKSPSPKPAATPTDEVLETDVPNEKLKLSDVVVGTATETPNAKVLGTTTENKKPVLAFVFIFTGILFLGYGGYLLYNMKHQNNENGSEKNQGDGSQTD